MIIAGLSTSFQVGDFIVKVGALAIQLILN